MLNYQMAVDAAATKTYLIIFINTAGDRCQVYEEGLSAIRVKDKFEERYTFDSILSVQRVETEE
jgi:hypothetical protein